MLPRCQESRPAVGLFRWRWQVRFGGCIRLIWLARYFSMVCSTEGYGLLLMRTRPGSTTVKASRSREPNLDTASITVADLARRAPLGNLTRITPADERPRA